jgi:DNA-binding CsgD family transcriptional regulator/tetratricopeptide (TPR) repeat protein
MLFGRGEETARIDDLLEAARGGRSAALVIRGEAGIGKSALLDYAAAASGDMQVLRCAGTESEAELAFAALHLVLRPGLGHLDALPEPQAAALRGAFGLAVKSSGDRFLIGLAALSVLSELAAGGPLVCLLDDAHWLDHDSAAALLFAARRLDAEGVVLLFAARDSGFGASGLAELRLGGLDRHAAQALLTGHAAGLTAQARERVLAQADGNPLALLELPAAAARSPVPETVPLSLPRRLQDCYLRQIQLLPATTRTFLLVAAAAGGNDLNVVLRAVKTLGMAIGAAAPAERSGLIAIEQMTVSFRHPLIKAAAYHAAVFAERQAAHHAIADALTSEHDADLRAWHRATAATSPDEKVAAELERAAARTSERQGHAAAAIALERAAGLTPGPQARARRLIAAAKAAAVSGRPDHALSMSEQAARLTTDPLELARIAQIQGTVADERGQTRKAHEILTAAAGSIAGLNAAASARMLAETIVAGRHDAVLTRKAFTQLQAVISPGAPRSLMAVDEAAASVEILIKTLGWSLAANAGSTSTPQRSLSTVILASLSGDYDDARDLGQAAAEECRATGLISLLPTIHMTLAATETQLDRFGDVAVTASEGLQLAIDTGQPLYAATLYGNLAWLAAIRGEEQRCREFASRAVRQSAMTDNPATGTWAEWALALLDLSAGRYDAALSRLESTSTTPGHEAILLVWFAADQVEAAVRLGSPDRAAAPLTRLTEWLKLASQQPATEAVLDRCQALTSPDAEAEEHYLAALRLHATSGRPYQRARTELLYGEWLRRARRSSEARGMLRGALERFQHAGAEPWAERARAELRAAGGKTAGTQPPPAAVTLLTPQELQVVRLAAAGETNRDIAARLFLSPRTVSHHLYRAFPKLGVATRTELARLDLSSHAHRTAAVAS